MNNAMKRVFKSALVTGASGGIGRATAVELARRGAERLFLGGRDAARLESAAAACREAGCPDVRTARVDTLDAKAVDDWISGADRAAPLDLVFANAGVAALDETEENARRVFAVNIEGTLNTVFPALRIFRARRPSGGHVAITSSIAGYAPLAACPAYAASKAALKAWGLSLRGRLAPEGVCVSVVCPGFVRSGITDRNTCPMPFFMEADAAARKICDGLSRGKGLVSFPWPMRLASWLLSILPWRIACRISGSLPEKRKSARQPPPQTTGGGRI